MASRGKKILIAAFLGASAQAALGVNLQSEGRVDFLHCMTGKFADIIQTPSLQAGYVQENYASTISKLEGSAFDGLGAYCAPIYLRQGDAIQIEGYCRYTDADGHSWIMRFSDQVKGGQAKGSFESVAGTGKFENITIRGEIAPANGLPPPAQPGVLNRCTRITGTYRQR